MDNMDTPVSKDAARATLATLAASNNLMGMTGEHASVLNLVKIGEANCVAYSSGMWMDGNVWLDGVIPNENSKVYIMPGVSVEICCGGAKARTVRVDGTLTYKTDKSTALRTETLVVNMEGKLKIGALLHNISRGCLAQLIFADYGEIDRAYDPAMLSRGLISMGAVDMCGATKTPYVSLLNVPKVGSTVLVMSEAPLYWEKGDEILLHGVNFGEDELFTILGIQGASIVLDKPIQYKRDLPTTVDPTQQAKLKLYVGNLTRNVVIKSEFISTNRRGHVMLMDNNVNIDYAAFVDLGRTDKSIGIDDTPTTGKNPRGRYALHFHKCPTNSSCVVAGSVVKNSPGWGFVNHSSRVGFVNNIGYACLGANFVTEQGDEIGDFYNNLSVGSAGVKDDANIRRLNNDFGFQGNGFWFNGVYISIANNIAAANKTSFNFWAVGLVRNGKETLMPAARVPELKANADIPINSLPIKIFRNNTCISGNVTTTLLNVSKKYGRTKVSENLFWNIRGGAMWIPYSHSITFTQNTIIGCESGFSQDSSPDDLDISKNYIDVATYGTCIVGPSNGSNSIMDNYLNGGTGISLPCPASQNGMGRSISIANNTFGPKTKIRYWMTYKNFVNTSPLHLPGVFAPDTVLIDGVKVYYPEQDVNYKLVGPALPPEMAGKTNLEIFAEYGLALGGALTMKGKRVYTGKVIQLKDKTYKLSYFTDPNNVISDDNIYNFVKGHLYTLEKVINNENAIVLFRV